MKCLECRGCLKSRIFESKVYRYCTFCKKVTDSEGKLVVDERINNFFRELFGGIVW